MLLTRSRERERKNHISYLECRNACPALVQAWTPVHPGEVWFCNNNIDQPTLVLLLVLRLILVLVVLLVVLVPAV